MLLGTHSQLLLAACPCPSVGAKKTGDTRHMDSIFLQSGAARSHWRACSLLYPRLSTSFLHRRWSGPRFVQRPAPIQRPACPARVACRGGRRGDRIRCATPILVPCGAMAGPDTYSRIGTSTPVPRGRGRGRKTPLRISMGELRFRAWRPGVANLPPLHPSSEVPWRAPSSLASCRSSSVRPKYENPLLVPHVSILPQSACGRNPVC